MGRDTEVPRHWPALTCGNITQQLLTGRRDWSSGCNFTRISNSINKPFLFFSGTCVVKCRKMWKISGVGSWKTPRRLSMHGTEPKTLAFCFWDADGCTWQVSSWSDHCKCVFQKLKHLTHHEKEAQIKGLAAHHTRFTTNSTAPAR